MNAQMSTLLPQVKTQMQHMITQMGLTPFPANLVPAARSLGLDADVNLSLWDQTPKKKIRPLVDMSSSRRTVRIDEAGSRYIGEIDGLRLSEPVGERRGLLAEIHELERARGKPLGLLVEDALGGSAKSFFSNDLERFSARDVLKGRKSGGGGNAIGYMMLSCDRAARATLEDPAVNDAVPPMLYSMASMFHDIIGISDNLFVMAMGSALFSDRFAFAALAGDMAADYWGWLPDNILRPVERSWEIAVADMGDDAEGLLDRSVVRRMSHAMNAGRWRPLASIYEDLARRSSDPFERGMNMARSAWALMQGIEPHPYAWDDEGNSFVWRRLFLEPLKVLLEGRGVSDDLLDIHREAMRFEEADGMVAEGETANEDSKEAVYGRIVERLKEGRLALGRMEDPPAKTIYEMDYARKSLEQMLSLIEADQ